jgi:ABC-2 type transport system permease protein
MRAAVWAFVVRDVRSAISYRVPFALEFVAVVFTVGSTWFVSKIVSPEAVEGGYFGFVILGLALGAFLYAGLTLASRNLLDEKQRGTLEATVGAGLPAPVLAVGISAFPMASAAVTAVAYVLVSLAFSGTYASPDWPLVVVATILVAVAFAGLGAAGAALALVVERSTAVLAWGVAMLGFLGGEFFPRELLPGWAEALGAFSPYTWALETVRAAALEGAGWDDLLVELAVLLAMAAASWALGAAAISAGLRVARRRGTLAGY